MIQIKKTILTLVALLAVTTGAWAQGKLIYEKDFSSDASYPFYLDAADKTGASATVTDGMLVLNNPKVQATNWDVQPEIGRLTSAAPTTQGNTYRVVMQYKTTVAGSVTFALGAQDWNNTDRKGQSITVSDDFQTCEGYFDSFPYSNSESHILLQIGSLVGTITIKKVEVYELYPFDGISWNASTKTATIAEMPAGNVFVVPEYYPQAALTAKPTAINDVPATTDGAIVNAGTVANIGETTTAQGTVMYYALQSATAPTAPDYDDTGWTDKVPTATDFAEGNVYVWYYIKGAEPASGTDRTDANTCSDSEITALGTTGYVTLLAAPKYNAEFAFDEGTPDAEKAKWGTNIPDGGVVKGTAVTVTYSGTKKVLGVKVAKPAGSLATPLTLEALTAGTIKVNNPNEGMQYSLNGGAKTTMSTTTTIDVAVGDKVQFYGNGTSITKYDDAQISGGTAQVKMYGNIMSLVDEENYATATELSADGFVFMNFFAGYEKLIDASGLLLPATKLSKNCYSYMFGGCSSLTAAPALPATTLVEGCYSSMFGGCSSLTAAYVKAANISEGSSPTDGMFSSCSATGAVLHTTTASQSSWNNLGANWSVVDDWND